MIKRYHFYRIQKLLGKCKTILRCIIYLDRLDKICLVTWTPVNENYISSGFHITHEGVNYVCFLGFQLCCFILPRYFTFFQSYFLCMDISVRPFGLFFSVYSNTRYENFHKISFFSFQFIATLSPHKAVICAVYCSPIAFMWTWRQMSPVLRKGK